MQTWTIKALLEWITPYLTDKGVDAPRLCAEMLICHVLGKQRIDLYTQFDWIVPQAQLEQLRALIKRASEHEPVAYLVGKTEFYSIELAIGPACLIPRPETELLVQHAIEALRTRTGEQQVLDLCTGSACISVALAKNCDNARVIAADISEPALKIARDNVRKYELNDRIELHQGDLFEPVTGQVFDMIVSNPPYVSDSEYEKLDQNVKAYEPRLALHAGSEGLDLYERMLSQMDSFLKPEGVLMLEIGSTQGPTLQAMLTQQGLFRDVQILKDFQGHDRVAVANR
jgi:release factor glutamine methyltransferase